MQDIFYTHQTSGTCDHTHQIQKTVPLSKIRATAYDNYLLSNDLLRLNKFDINMRNWPSWISFKNGILSSIGPFPNSL